MKVLLVALVASVGISCQQAALPTPPQVNVDPPTPDYGPLALSPDLWSDAAVRTFEDMLKPRRWTQAEPTRLAMILKVTSALSCATEFDPGFKEHTSAAPGRVITLPREIPAFELLDLILWFVRNAEGVRGAYTIRQDGSLRFGWTPDLAHDRQTDLAAILAGRQRVKNATTCRRQDWDGIDDEPIGFYRKAEAKLTPNSVQLKLVNASALEAQQALIVQNIPANCTTLLGTTGKRFDFDGRGPLPVVLDHLCAVSGLGWYVSKGEVHLADPTEAQRERERIATAKATHATQVAALERQMDTTGTIGLAAFAKSVQRLAGIPVIAMPRPWMTSSLDILPGDRIRSVLLRARDAGLDWGLYEGCLCFIGS